jgi:hypothetical protein
MADRQPGGGGVRGGAWDNGDAGHGILTQERKRFFFEKKKQKTFDMTIDGQTRE